MRINSQGWSLIFSIGTMFLTFLILDKEERRKKYQSMSNQERKQLILKKTKAKRFELGSAMPNKNNSI